MSRGLGKLQVGIKTILTRASEHNMGALHFSDIRAVMVIENGGNPERGDKLGPSDERAAKRALTGLVDRGEVLIIGGRGGPGDPYRYATIEALTGESDTARAKEVWRKMAEQVQKLADRQQAKVR